MVLTIKEPIFIWMFYISLVFNCSYKFSCFLSIPGERLKASNEDLAQVVNVGGSIAEKADDTEDWFSLIKNRLMKREILSEMAALKFIKTINWNVRTQLTIQC